MLFILPCILLVGCIIWYVLTIKYTHYDEFVPECIMCIFIGIVITMVIILICCYIGVDGNIAACEAQYESLVYQYENDLYDNDNDLGKKELMDEIREWNTDLARKQANQRDFWIGIFIPNIFDRFEFIELK